jgi:hypothetical protein
MRPADNQKALTTPKEESWKKVRRFLYKSCFPRKPSSVFGQPRVGLNEIAENRFCFIVVRALGSVLQLREATGSFRPGRASGQSFAEATSGIQQ